MPITAGAHKVNITPPIGFPLAGYGNREKGSEGLDDELYAKALVLDDGNTKVPIVTTDLIAVSPSFVASVRQRVERKTGIPATNVMVCASHTHFGPALKHLVYLPQEAQAEFHGAYVENASRLIAGAVQLADASRRDARIGHGLGNAEPLVFNRRPKGPDGKMVMTFRPPKPEDARSLTLGPTDPEVPVLTVEGTDGVAIATLISLACHPVCGVDRLYRLSADYPGYAMKVVEEVTGGVCMFALGCAGNIVPAEREGPARRRIGMGLGGEVVKVLHQMETSSDVELRVLSETIELPVRPLPTPEEAQEQVEDAERKLAAWDETETAAENLRTPRGELAFARHLKGMVEELGAQTTVTTETQAIRIGDLVLMCLPGEVYVEIGLKIKERSANTFVFSLCNDGLDYVPTAAAYDEGGYEPEWTKLAKGADKVLTDAAVGLVEKVRG